MSVLYTLSIAWRRNIEGEIVTDLHEIYMQKLSCMLRSFGEWFHLSHRRVASRTAETTSANDIFFLQTDFVFFPSLSVDIPRESSWVMRSKKLVTLFTLLIHKSFFTDGILVKNAKHFHSTKRTLSSMLSLQSQTFVDFYGFFIKSFLNYFPRFQCFSLANES